jgi:hypothetical protein
MNLNSDRAGCRRAEKHYCSAPNIIYKGGSDDMLVDAIIIPSDNK